MVRLAIFALSLLCLIAGPIAAQEIRDESWLREPALSPDGTRIAFRYKGQIWTASVEGGTAVALTPSGSHASRPSWSPDGQTLAFASDRFGALNIDSVAAGGGEARRLTWYSIDEQPMGFTPDGQSVIFASPRLGDAVRTFAPPGRSELSTQVYSVPVGGGRETLVLPNAALDVQSDPSGKRLLYTSANVEQPLRQHQVSRAVRQIWLYDAVTGRHERLTDGMRESRNPVWLPDGDVAFLSEASGSLNVWRLSLADRAPHQVTRFAAGAVRNLTASRLGDLAFAREGRLYRLRRGAIAPDPMPVRPVDANFPGEVASVTTDFRDLVVSPTGLEIALVAHGDIYVTARDGKWVKRITRTAGEERDPTFSPDGRRLVYAAERDGRWGLYEASPAAAEERGFAQATRLVERRLSSSGTDAFLPSFAPDGRHLAYVRDRAAVNVLDLTDGSDVTLIPPGRHYAYFDWSWWLSWSPDSRWLAFPLQLDRSFADNVAVAPADGARPPLRVAPAGEHQGQAIWSTDGEILVWPTDSEALNRARRSDERVDIEAVFGSRRAKDAFEARLRVPTVAEPEAERQRTAWTPAAMHVTGASSGAEPSTAPEHRATANPRPEPLPFDPDGLEDRRYRLSQAPGHIVYAGLLADGVSVLTVERSANARDDGFTVSGTVRDLRLEHSRTLFSSLGYKQFSPVRMSRDRRFLYFLDRTGFVEVDLARGIARTVRVEAEDVQDPDASRHAAFEQLWRLTKLKFLDPSMHGVDWEAVRARYRRALPSLGDARDLAELLSEMAGELDASHTGAYLMPSVPPGEETAALGLYYDSAFAGPGVRVAALLPGGPFDVADTRLAPGDVLTAIDGEPIPEAGGVYRILRGRKNKLVEVTFRKPDGTEARERRVPVPLARERDLAFERWRRNRREAVLARSCGRLGYVHVRAMDAGSYRHTAAEIFGRFSEAEALIVDVRFNGGGNLHNQLLTLLSGHSYLTLVPRDGPKQHEPRDRWAKPSAVLVNGASYSDASVFPRGYRDLGIGPVVGEPVAGTGTFVWWASSAIVPRLIYGLPQIEVRGRDGTILENADVVPDVIVAPDPAAWAEGRDPQLDAVIALLLAKGATCPGGPSGAQASPPDSGNPGRAQ